MKKKLLLMAAFVTALVGANAQSYIQFDGYEDRYVDNNYQVESNIEAGDITIFATSSSSMRINNNNQRFNNGSTYTARLQTTGRSADNGRHIEVDAKSSGTLTLAVRTGGSNARVVTVTLDGTELLRKSLSDETVVENIDGEDVNVHLITEVAIPNAGNVQIGWEESLYFYSIEFVEGDVDPTDPTDPEPGEDEVTEWTFDSSAYLLNEKPDGETIDIGEYPIENGMTIIVTAEDRVKLELTKKIANDSPSQIATIGALNAGGSGNGFSIANVKAGDIINIAFAPNGTVAADNLRGINVFENDSEEPTAELRSQAGDANQFVRDYVYEVKNDGEVKFISVLAVSIYNVILSSDGSGSSGGTSIEDTTSDLEVIATTYYNVAGVQFNAPQKGLNIIKETYEDGSVKVSKAYIK